MKSRYLTTPSLIPFQDPEFLEPGRGRFWPLSRIVSLVAIPLGVVLMILGEWNAPHEVSLSTGWAPAALTFLLGLTLLVMGGALILVSGVVFRLWRKGDRLRLRLDEEITRSRTVEKNLERAQGISKTGNWVLDISSQTMKWSDEVSRILGCKSQSTPVDFEQYLKSIHPDDRGMVKEKIHKTFNQGTALNLQYRMIRQDGSIRMVKQRSEIYLDQTGNPVQILGTLQDITDHKETEDRAMRLSRIIDKSFNEIYFFDAETLKLTKANLAARLNLRYNVDELYEKTPMDLLPEFTWDKFEKLIKSLKSGIESSTAFETVHKRKNGTLYPVDVRLQFSTVETRPQFVAIVQDISDRQKIESLFSKVQQDIESRVQEKTTYLQQLNKDLEAEVSQQNKALKKLEDSEHRLIEIMNNVDDAIITIDAAGEIHFFNRAAERMFGFKIEEAVGGNINELMAGMDDPEHKDYFRNLLQSEKSAALGLRRVITAKKKDGSVFYVQLSVNQTVISGQLLYTGLFRDIEEKKETGPERLDILTPALRT